MAEEKVFRCNEVFAADLTWWNKLKMMVALALWLGLVHFNAAFIPFSSLLFLPLFTSLLIFALLFVFVTIPIDENSNFGKKLSSYFPITLHVEDIKAFNPNRAYVFGYEPHSILSNGIIALTSSTGLMPLPKMKFLANNVERRGFVRIAMEKGKPLVPVFCFGQSDIYNWWKPNSKLILNFARAIKFIPLYYWGIFGSPIPFKRPLYVAVGKPIDVNKNPEPTMEEFLAVTPQASTIQLKSEPVELKPISTDPELALDDHRLYFPDDQSSGPDRSLTPSPAYYSRWSAVAVSRVVSLTGPSRPRLAV
ncbi:Diacylglycerol O-acyltransferase 2 [Stylosanthes scabra]|uniref:Acyltransferase n=1 Tax=Stylosanthes scabra TaxID=79078 RepID=A0ABU6X7E6_9FABA|nr:Diacylglycerol O-acyltransferase 2 [Stylosanthes scabra]